MNLKTKMAMNSSKFDYDYYQDTSNFYFIAMRTNAAIPPGVNMLATTHDVSTLKDLHVEKTL